jgi:hypothetical protein
MRKLAWKILRWYLKDLSRDERVELLNFFNKEINAFPVDDCVVIKANGGILANGKQMTLEQREAFLQGAKSLLSNTAFNLIADQVVFQSMKVGLHDATEFDHLYFSKTAMYFVDLFKKYLENLGKLA